MSRSAAIFSFADGAVFYGLHCNTVDVRCPLFFRTKEERKKYWNSYRTRDISKDYEPCGCPGEVVRTGAEYNDEKSYVPDLVGMGCREHGRYFGPYNDDPPDELDCCGYTP
jgi:hypothetical protein